MSKRRKQLPADATVQITGLAHDGRGIARVNDKILFVFGALPQETVRVKYTRAHSRYDEAHTIEVLEPVKERNQPACEHFGLCGGCQLQHLHAPLQIHYKQNFLADLLMNQAKVTPKQWLAPLTDSPLGYRQKARLGVRYVHKKQTLLVGFREQNNNKIAMLSSCQVLDPRVGSQLQNLRELIGSLQAKEHIPQIEVAIGGEEVALVFRHVAPLSNEDIHALTRFCQQHHFSLYLQSGGVDSVKKVFPVDEKNYLTYTLADQNLCFRFHPLDFTQVNANMNQKMINQALALLKLQKDDEVLDLFCGLGNFSLPIAQQVARVVGVEGCQQMVNKAQENAQLNGLPNVEFFACDLSTNTLKEAPWAKRSYHKVVLDPPRCGAQEAIEQLAHLKPQEILYISCNPATFARDAGILVHQQGYCLEKVGVMDMFAQTAHVETMGLFSLQQA